jgi:cytochrome c oxidase subunit 1
MYNEAWAKFSALILFVGFNLTFFPQFILGYMGMPRRYYVYPPEFQVLNVVSTAGASLRAWLHHPMIYLIWSLRQTEDAGTNPWVQPTRMDNAIPTADTQLDRTPVVTQEPYARRR